MKNLLIILALLLFAGCKKDEVKISANSSSPNPLYAKYSISVGEHYCDKSAIKAFAGTHINFNVKFDSTAIYKTKDPVNQYDINKLYGFSEGIDNHINSARIGWSWNKNALRLYAYVYADGIRNFKEISTVAIGAVIYITISVSKKEYIFSVNEKKLSLPRALEDATVSGYWQYPYFGGNETAPHNTYIYILDTQN